MAGEKRNEANQSLSDVKLGASKPQVFFQIRRKLAIFQCEDDSLLQGTSLAQTDIFET